MSYQVLARKWRPRGFTSLVGQEHVVRALTHALTAGRPAAIASANVGCIGHLGGVAEIPVRHWIELIDARLSA